MSDTAIDIRHVSKRFRLYRHSRTTLRERFTRRPATSYDEFWGLRDIDLRVPRGSVVGLIGYNGSGKSTLLKLIAGIHRPTSGTIAVVGRLVALLELGAGFHPDLTGRENVILNGATLGLSRRTLQQRMDDIADFAGIGEFLDSPVKVYSSGMVVRLAFAVAVNAVPDVLLIDEIVAVGDEEFQRKCLERLHELRVAGVTVVIVSHDLNLVRDVCDVALWLDHGESKMLGPAAEVTDAYVTSVNQREAAASREHGAHALGAADQIRGSGAIHITSFEYLSAGEPVEVVHSGDPLTIRLDYEADDSVLAADFTLVVHRESGEPVAEVRSSDTGQSILILPGAGSAEFTVDELLLLPGIYFLTTIIQRQGHTFECRDRFYRLTVRGTGRVRAGVVQLPGQWEFR